MKKIITVVLVLLFCSNFLMSNGQEEQNLATLEELGFKKEGYPIVNSPVNIDILLPMRPQMQSVDKFTVPNQVSEKTGVNGTFNGIPLSVYSQKKQLLIASGDLPDVFWGTQSMNTEELEKYGREGIVLRLNDYIDEYMPNLKRILDNEPGYRERMSTSTGDMYYLPQIIDDIKQPVKGKMFINKKWLDKLGLAIPTTIYELTNVLEAFKNNDPNGNGVDDEVPMVVSDITHHTTAISSLVQLFGSFGRHGSGFIVEDGEVLFAPAEKEYLDAIKYFKTYIDKDLVNKDMFFLSITDYWKVFKSSPDNTVGFCFSFGPGDVVAKRFVDDFIPLTPVKGPNGDNAWHRNYTFAYGSSVGAVINGNTPYPEIVLRYLDEFYAPEFSVQTFYGAVGDVLSKDDAGNYTFNFGSSEIWEKRYLFTPSDGPIYMNKEYISSSFSPDINQEGNDEYRKYYKVADASYLLPKLDYTDEEFQYFRERMVDIDNLVLTARLSWLMGDVDVSEKEWEIYLEKLESMNISEITRIKNDAFKRANLIFRDFE